MANTKRGNPIFAVRLPAETQAAIREAAKQNGLGVAEWVANAVRMALDSPQEARAVASGEKVQPDSGDELDAIRGRLAALEAALAAGATMPPQSKPVRKRPSKHFDAEDQAQPAPEGAAPEERNREWFKPPAFKRLSDAGVAEVRRRFDAGEPDEDIAKAVGLSQQAVNKHTKRWRSS